jgi:hypothetical protein
MKKPSIDRKNSDNHYSFDNCRFLELNKNSSLATAKKVLQFTKDGKFINEFSSVTKANKYMKCSSHSSQISSCCNGNAKSAFGFIWKHKEI